MILCLQYGLTYWSTTTGLNVIKVWQVITYRGRGAIEKRVRETERRELRQ